MNQFSKLNKSILKAEIWEIQAILYLIASILLVKICDTWIAHTAGWLMLAYSIATFLFAAILKAIKRAEPDMSDKSIFEEEK